GKAIGKTLPRLPWPVVNILPVAITMFWYVATDMKLPNLDGFMTRITTNWYVPKMPKISCWPRKKGTTYTNVWTMAVARPRQIGGRNTKQNGQPFATNGKRSLPERKIWR